MLQAVVDVVMHQRLLGVYDGPFDRLQPSGDFQRFTFVFEHVDDALHLAVGTLQALNHFVRMCQLITSIT